MSFVECWENYRLLANDAIEMRLPQPGHSPDALHQAMRYATMNGGKRLRASLVYMTGEMLGTEKRFLDAPAAAVEYIHAYSLIHDDLPPMDNDDERRGKPASHILYDEAIAILAGDALQSLAFEVLATDSSLVEKPEAQCKMIAALAQGIGIHGMVGGQFLDIYLAEDYVYEDTAEKANLMKTAALFKASVRLGALASCVEDSALHAALDEYADCIGLAFQCIDDMMDEEKPDRYWREFALKKHNAALSMLDNLEFDTSKLRGFADFVVNRSF